MLRSIVLLCFALLLLANASQTIAQSQQPQLSDTTRTAIADTTKRQAKMGGEEEIELSEILIEAVVEKPRVAILPRRLAPELGEMEFVNRSFEQELKQAPEKPMILDNRLLVPQKIEDLKKKLINPKQEQNKK